MSTHAAIPTGKLVHATPETAPMVEGRRSFLKYQDLGVSAASSGRMRAQVMCATAGMTKPTGWHYHVCEGQFVYALKGWVDLEFEDGQSIRLQAGQTLYIPGRLRHNEIATSDTRAILEVSVSATIGTAPSDPPEGRTQLC